MLLNKSNTNDKYIRKKHAEQKKRNTKSSKKNYNTLASIRANIKYTKFQLVLSCII